MYRSCRCMYRSARSWAGVILTGSAGGCEASGWLGRGSLRSLGLSPRWRLRGLGSRCWDGFFGRHRLRRLGLVFAPGWPTSSLRDWCGRRGFGRRGHGGRSRLRLRLSRLCRLCSRGIRL